MDIDFSESHDDDDQLEYESEPGRDDELEYLDEAGYLDDLMGQPMAEGWRRCRAPTGTAEAPSATTTGSVYDIDAGPVRNGRRG
jgi:hypothetical protein